MISCLNFLTNTNCEQLLFRRSLLNAFSFSFMLEPDLNCIFFEIPKSYYELCKSKWKTNFPNETFVLFYFKYISQISFEKLRRKWNANLISLTNRFSPIFSLSTHKLNLLVIQHSTVSFSRKKFIRRFWSRKSHFSIAQKQDFQFKFQLNEKIGWNSWDNLQIFVEIKHNEWMLGVEKCVWVTIKLDDTFRSRVVLNNIVFFPSIKSTQDFHVRRLLKYYLFEFFTSFERSVEAHGRLFSSRLTLCHT